jgi:WD40 repeat protein
MYLLLYKSIGWMMYVNLLFFLLQDLLSVSSDKTINSINVAKQKMQFEIQNAHKYPIHTFICCTDNVIASGDDEGYVKVWDIRKGGKPVASFAEHAEYVSSFDYEDEDKILYSASADGTLCIQDLRKMKVVDISKPYEKDFLCCCEMSNGEHVAVGTSKGDILVFDCCKWESHASKIATDMGSVDSMLFITEDMMACGSADGIIRLYSLKAKRMVSTLCTSEDPIYKMSLSPNGLYIASCGFNNVVRFWNSAGLYGVNLSEKIAEEERMEQSEGKDEPVTDTTSNSVSDMNNNQQSIKKRKKNTEKVDERKKKRVYNSEKKAFFHDLVNEY